jgi:hypothetical protein
MREASWAALKPTDAIMHHRGFPGQSPRPGQLERAVGPRPHQGAVPGKWCSAAGGLVEPADLRRTLLPVEPSRAGDRSLMELLSPLGLGR